MNPPNTPPYVIGPDGKTLGFYDAQGNFIPSDAMTKYGDPYLNQGMDRRAYPLSMFQAHASPYATAGIMQQYNSPFTPKAPTEQAIEDIKASLANVQMNQQVQQPTLPVTQPQGTAQDITGISDALKNAEVVPTSGAPAQGTGMTPGARNAYIGLGANAITALSGIAAPNQYDYRVGMEKPGLGQFGNLTFTGMGASLGPAGAAAGFGVDMVKNAVGYFKHKQQYNTAENKADFMDWRNKLMQTQMPDYTGLARDGIEIKPENRGKFTNWAEEHGMGVQEAANKVMSNTDEYPASVVKMANFAKNAASWGREGMEAESDGDADDKVPVEIERNERVYTKTPYGYALHMETPPDAPTHEQGGIKTELPVGALVFPKQYFNELDKAEKQGMQFGDWSLFNDVKEKMKQNAKEAYQQGKPYSTGGKP